MADQKVIMELVASSGVLPDTANFDPAKSFKENGIDSLDVMSVLLAVEEHFGIKFSDEEATRFRTVNDICNLLSQKGI